MRDNSPAPSPIEPHDEERPRHHKPNGFKNMGTVIGTAALVVLGGGSYLVSTWSPAAEGHSRKHDDRSPDEKLDQVLTDLNTVSHDLATAKTDIAVIKRQLGLDGLGAPPPDRIPIRSSRIDQRIDP